MDTKYTCAHYPKKSESPNSQAFKEFNSNHADFFIYGPSQSSYLMLEKIINSNSVPVDIKKLKLKQLVLEVFKEIALNELHLSIWAILLEKTVWKDNKYNLRQRLIFSALYSKEFLGEQSSYLFDKHSHSDPSFSVNYSEWKAERLLFNPNIKEINQMYSRLIGEKNSVVNYTYYVDELIEQYVPYKISKKAKVEKLPNPVIKILKDESDEVVLDSESLDGDDKAILQPLPLLGQHGGNSTLSGSQPNIDSISLLLNFDV